MSAPLVLGLGGTLRAGSSSEVALRFALDRLARMGARTEILAGEDLVLPMYAPDAGERDARAARLVDLVRRADAVVLASPGYHGSISGMLKNGLDYLEDTRADPRPYLDGLPVGCIVAAYGWQAACSTLAALRTTVHALRGWPTPLGVTINSAVTPLEPGADPPPAVREPLLTMAGQLSSFLRLTAAS